MFMQIQKAQFSYEECENIIYQLKDIMIMECTQDEYYYYFTLMHTVLDAGYVENKNEINTFECAPIKKRQHNDNPCGHANRNCLLSF